MKAYFVTGLLTLFLNTFSTARPAVEDTLRINQKEAEALFINSNLDLVAQKLSIQQAEAQIIQAKLWPNPEFSIDELNLWATRNQLSSGETIPPLFGNFGRNREFTAELSQVIETGGKRRKRVALESVSRDMAAEYFSELIRNLKTELRENFNELLYHQSYLSVLLDQRQALDYLLANFEKQYSLGNINKPELFRLKALKLDLGQQILEVRKEVHAAQKELSVVLNLPAATYLVIESGNEVNPATLKTLSLDNLITAAVSNRPDGKISLMQQTWAQRKYDLEYAQRKPDLNFNMNYDRGGNFLLNFFGFGLRMDLPVFNRNQGMILESKIGIEKSKTESEQKIKNIEAEVTEAFRNLRRNVDAFQELDPAYGRDLDQVFASYTQYFAKRQINMVEYLDFFDAYISNKKTILMTARQLMDSREALSFVTGSEIN